MVELYCGEEVMWVLKVREWWVYRRGKGKGIGMWGMGGKKY